LTKHDALNKLAVAEHHLRQAHLIAIQMGVNEQAVDIKHHVFTAVTICEEIGRGFQPALVCPKAVGK
jgi:hypothetical protein